MFFEKGPLEAQVSPLPLFVLLVAATYGLGADCETNESVSIHCQIGHQSNRDASTPLMR
jgi:hypothetical protein